MQQLDSENGFIGYLLVEAAGSASLDAQPAIDSNATTIDLHDNIDTKTA